MSKVYLNGKPLNFWQKIIAGIVSVLLIIFMIVYAFIFFVLFAIAVVFGLGFLMWKTRKVRAEINRQTKKNQVHETFHDKETGRKGETYEGSFKEL